MGRSINLLKNYQVKKSKKRSEENSKVRSVAENLGKIFDGDRKFGYGCFEYNDKFWKILKILKDIGN